MRLFGHADVEHGMLPGFPRLPFTKIRPVPYSSGSRRGSQPPVSRPRAPRQHLAAIPSALLAGAQPEGKCLAQCEKISNTPSNPSTPFGPSSSRPSSISNTTQTSSNPSLDSHTSSSHSDLEAVSQAAWEAAVEDGKRFLAKWGAQAEALGWTEQDLFGLHRPPDKPAAGYSRLARYDATGLVWLLRGRRVCALTERSAAIKNRTSGTVTHFRRGRT